MAASNAKGRPTKYKKEFVAKAVKLYELGATDDEVADFFDIDRATLYRWRNKYQDFCDAQRIGKAPADDRAELALYQRALGYSHESEEIKVIDGQVVRVPVVKHYPPDTTALIFWNKNRRPDKWRDKQEVEVSGFDAFIQSLEADEQ